MIRFINIALALVLATNLVLLSRQGNLLGARPDSKVSMYTEARNDVHAKRERFRTMVSDQAKHPVDGVMPVILASSAPEIHRQISRSTLRRKAVAPYLSFLQELNLTPENRAKAINLLIEKYVTDEEIQAALIERGIKQKGTAAYNEAFSGLTREFNGELENLLGSTNYEQLLKWPAYAAFRQELDASVRIDLKEAGLPLDDVQLDHVASLLVKNLGSVYEDRRAERDSADFLSRPEREFLSALSQTLDGRRIEIIKTALQEKNQVYEVMKKYPDIDRRF